MGTMSARQLEYLSEHLRKANFLYAPGGENSESWLQSNAEDAVSQRVIAELGAISQKLSQLPHDETGFNTLRIAGFFQRYGLASKPFIGVDEEGQQSINEIMGFGRGPTKTVASHFPLSGFTYVVRGMDEDDNESKTREATVVHESAHANQPYMDVLVFERPADDDIGYTLLRNGFTSRSAGKDKKSQTTGSYYEEGFASLMSHKYINEELGYRDGLLDTVKPLELTVESDNSYMLPGSYVYRGSVTGTVKWATSAHAAYGLQLLISKDPEMFPTILAARKGAAGLREFAGRVDALDHGLYTHLRNQPYDEMHFRKSTNYIIDRLYDGDPHKALEVAAQQDREKTSELLAA